MSQTAQTGRPGSLPRGLLILLGTAAAVITVAGLKAVDDIVAPAFFALVLMIVVHPVRRWLDRHGMPGWVGALACVLIVYLVLITLSLAMLVATARFADLLPAYRSKFADLLDSVGDWLRSVGIDQVEAHRILGSFDLSGLTGAVGSVLAGAFGLASNLVFILTLLLFLGMDAGGFTRRLGRLVADRVPAATALVSFAHGTRRYFLVSSVFGFIVAVIDTVALALMGIPVPLLWGLLAFITNYIPNIGFVIGLVPPAVLGLLEGGPGLMIAVIVVYSVINLVIQSIVQPKYVGDAVGLSTTLTFLSLVFWTWVIGPLGALLAVPLSLLVKALLVDVDPSAAWLRPLLSGQDEPGGQSGIVTTSTTE